MLIELKNFVDSWSKTQALFGGSGGGRGGDDDADKGKERDPFENFDFTRFKSSRPQNNSTPGDGGTTSGKDKEKDKDKKDVPLDDQDIPPRRSSSSGSGGNRNNNGGQFGGFGNQFGGFGGSGQIAELRFPRPSRGAVFLIILGLILVALFIIGPGLLGFWTDLLWFEEVGQTGVFWTRIWQPLVIYFAAFVLAFAVIMTNVSVARRFGPSGPVINSADNPLSALLGGGVRFLNTIFIIGAVIISLVLAGAASGNTSTVFSFLNAASWTERETIFNRTIGFYVFEAPFYSFLQGWLAGLLIVALIAALAVYFLRFSLSGRAFTFTPAIKTHASVLGALILGLFALGYQISNWNLVYSNRGRAPGTGATDFDAQFPANNILTVIVAVAALILLANIFIRDLRRGVSLLIGAIALWIVAHLLVGGLYPSFYQNLSVTPNAITKEREYIENTIKMTRKAYGLEVGRDLTVVPFQGTAALTQKDIQDNPYIQENSRLWDYDKLRGIYDVTQTLRPYYDFPDIDIDRYNLALNGGQPRKTQVMLGVRELDLSQLRNRNWQSLHLQYTHGYGIQASPVNQVDSSGRPVNLITQSFPLSSTLLPVAQPRVYFGQKPIGSEYSIVGTNLDEIDFPLQGQGEETKFKYDGKGGIGLSNIFVKAAFAAKLGDFNLLISEAVNERSRVIFRRTIGERVQQIAPFLIYDRDAYIAVADGRLYWIQDAYTTSGLFPHSDPIGDRRASNRLNYIRNSVKVIIDAYDGTTTFYLMDKPGIDPIAQTYANIYPGLFKPLNQMPAALQEHLRYPEDLFKIQTERYQLYHVNDPNKYFNNEDQWQIPADPRPADSRPANSGSQFEPYYLVTRLPNERENEFVLINVFQQQNRNTLVSLMAARMDGDNYGKLMAYTFNSSVNIDNPTQFYTKIQALPEFSRQQSLLGAGSSRLPPGPIIIIPVDNSVLYVMPYYLQGNQTAVLPQLQFVATGANERVYISQPDNTDDRTRLLPAALNEVFTRGQQVAVAPGGTGQPGATPGPGATPAPAVVPTQPPGASPAAVPGATPASGIGVPVGPTIAPNQQASIAELTRSVRAHQELASQAFAAGDAARGNEELRKANEDLARLNQLLGR